jgi:hypothetical protein
MMKLKSFCSRLAVQKGTIASRFAAIQRALKVNVHMEIVMAGFKAALPELL